MPPGAASRTARHARPEPSGRIVADHRHLGHALAAAFLAGPWEADAMLARGRRVLGRRPAWLRAVVDETLLAYHRPPRDRPRELGAYVAIVLAELPRPPRYATRVRRPALFTTEMPGQPWPVPPLDAPGDLAEALELDAGQLAWLADVRGLERTAPEKARNYRYLHVARKAAPPRVIERPKLRLKEVQRWILRELLAWVPVHPAAHGFVAGRSALTHAAAHTGRRVVVRLDVADFFAAVTAARVYGIFRTAGYPEPVAHALTGLCTNVVPPEHSVADFHLARRLATPHLPQGAPTSPALANLAAFRLDARLSGLARELGATYTRYADDLVLSCDHRLRPPLAALAEITAAEGFKLNPRKTRVMSRGRRQTVTGIVVNVRPNVPREDYDRLKATLHRATLDGPGDLDAASLLGRIAWVASLNPARGAKLRARFDAIRWSA